MRTFQVDRLIYKVTKQFLSQKGSYRLIKSLGRSILVNFIHFCWLRAIKFTLAKEILLRQMKFLSQGVMGMFNVLWGGSWESFKNAKAHCILHPSHNPLRGDYRRKSQETTKYKADVFENWRRTDLIFLVGKIQKGGGVSSRTKAFFGARYFIQPRGKF